jgi:hypothetical protein
MVQQVSDCPGEERVVAFAAGRLSDDEARSFEEHVDRCDRCRKLLAEAARDSTFQRREPGRASDAFGASELIADRYRITRFLARGGMGEVYEARDTWLDEKVALKTLIPEIADSPTALARFKAEVKLTRSISHENICRVFDVGFHTRKSTRAGREPERIPFLTMELLDGQTLRAHLVNHGPLGASDMLPIAKGIVQALANAHAAGIVHRDFKSDNVMLVGSARDAARRIVVTDFGLARSSLVAPDQPLTDGSRAVLGTLDYMAPEQVEGRPATKQSDIYSLGIVLFEAMTGELPFVGVTPLARALARVQGAPRKPMDVVASVGPVWQKAILRCIEVDPRRRFARVEDLLSAVEPAASHRSGARALGGWRALAVAASCVAIAAAIAAAVGMSRERPSEKNPGQAWPPAPSTLAVADPIPSSTSTPALPVMVSAEPVALAPAPSAKRIAVPASLHSRAAKPPAPVPSGPAPAASHLPSADSLIDPYSR